MKNLKTICSLCIGYCDIIVYLDEGKITKVVGDRESKHNFGYLCPQGLSIKEIVYSKNRVLFPKIKSNNKWKKTTWNNALNQISKKLEEIKQKYGPETVVFHTHLSSTMKLLTPLANLFGSPNVSDNDFVCVGPRRLALTQVFGYQRLFKYFTIDYKKTKCLAIWGQNSTHPIPLAIKIYNAIKEGVKLIVVDPRETVFASKADIHLKLRPGTDGALALSMLNVIINNNLHDKEFIEKYTTGFKELKKLVNQYPPEKAEEITWIPKEKIIKAAKMYATNKPAAISLGNGLDQHTNNFNAIRAISYLPAITANINKSGGNILVDPVYKKSFSPVNRKDKAIGQEKLPIFPKAHLPSIIDAILTGKPYPIKAMILLGGNPLVTCANTDIVLKALKKLELLVVVDRFLTETAKQAHILLPTTTRFEEDNPKTGQPRIINPQGESWPDQEIIMELAKKLNISFSHPQEISYPNSKKKLPTPTGKIEFYSEKLKQLGHNPLPNYKEPFMSPYSQPKLSKQYPLILTTGARLPMYYHSQNHNIPKLKKLKPHNIAEIHPITAEKYNIKNNQQITIQTPTGQVKIKTKITKKILKDTIHMHHGYKDANPNKLINHKPHNPLTGSTQLKSTICKIK